MYFGNNCRTLFDAVVACCAFEGNLPPTVYERTMAAREPIVVSEIN